MIILLVQAWSPPSLPVVTDNKQKQSTCAEIRLARVTIIYIMKKQGNKWIERQVRKGEIERNNIYI